MQGSQGQKHACTNFMCLGLGFPKDACRMTTQCLALETEFAELMQICRHSAIRCRLFKGRPVSSFAAHRVVAAFALPLQRPAPADKVTKSQLAEILIQRTLCWPKLCYNAPYRSVAAWMLPPPGCVMSVWTHCTFSITQQNIIQ